MSANVITSEKQINRSDGQSGKPPLYEDQEHCCGCCCYDTSAPRVKNPNARPRTTAGSTDYHTTGGFISDDPTGWSGAGHDHGSSGGDNGGGCDSGGGGWGGGDSGGGCDSGGGGGDSGGGGCDSGGGGGDCGGCD